MISSVFPVYWGTKTGVNMKLKSPHYPGHARGGGGNGGFKWLMHYLTGIEIAIPFFLRATTHAKIGLSAFGE